MNIILDTPFWTVKLDKELAILRVKWKIGAENIATTDFKQHLLAFCDEIEKHKVRGFLVDARQAHVVILSDLQDWHDATIAPRYVANQLEKIAFLMPSDIFATVSINQTFNETSASKLAFRYFDDPAEAEIWFRN